MKPLFLLINYSKASPHDTCLGVLEEPVSHIVTTQTHTMVRTEPINGLLFDYNNVIMVVQVYIILG